MRWYKNTSKTNHAKEQKFRLLLASPVACSVTLRRISEMDQFIILYVIIMSIAVYLDFKNNKHSAK
jgi:hypothetical protein